MESQRTMPAALFVAPGCSGADTPINNFFLINAAQNSLEGEAIGLCETLWKWRRRTTFQAVSSYCSRQVFTNRRPSGQGGMRASSADTTPYQIIYTTGDGTGVSELVLIQFPKRPNCRKIVPSH